MLAYARTKHYNMIASDMNQNLGVYVVYINLLALVLAAGVACYFTVQRQRDRGFGIGWVVYFFITTTGNCATSNYIQIFASVVFILFSLGLLIADTAALQLIAVVRPEWLKRWETTTPRQWGATLVFMIANALLYAGLANIFFVLMAMGLNQ